MQVKICIEASIRKREWIEKELLAVEFPLWWPYFHSGTFLTEIFFYLPQVSLTETLGVNFIQA